MIEYFITELDMRCPAPIVRQIKDINLSSPESRRTLSYTTDAIDEIAGSEPHDYRCFKAYVGYIGAQITYGMRQEVYDEWLYAANLLAKQDKTPLYAVVQQAMSRIPIDSVNLGAYLITAGLYQFPLPAPLLSRLSGQPILEPESLRTYYARYLMITDNPEGLRLLDEAAYHFEPDVNKLGTFHEQIRMILISYSLKQHQVEGLIRILSRYQHDNRAGDGVNGKGTGTPISLRVQNTLNIYSKSAYGFNPQQ